MNRKTGLLYRALLVLLQVTFLYTASSQCRPDEEFEFFKKKYPDEGAVFVKRNQAVDLQIRNDSLSIIIDTYEEIIYLGDNPTLYARDQVFSSSFSRISDLEAYTLLPGKRKYQKVEVTDFNESYDRDSYVFYNDSKEISFTYPSLKQGAKTVLKYRYHITDPRMINLFFFNSFLPVEESAYTIRADEGIDLETRIFNDDEGKIVREAPQPGDGINTLEFRASRLEKVRYEENRPSFSYIGMSVYCLIKSYKTAAGTSVPVLSSLEDLHAWYQTFTAHLGDRSNEIKAIVSSIINEDDSRMEKVKKIYYWVQSNIKYIAFEAGMRGLIPHTGDYVIGKRYGDCKDMASLIVSMLREADIEAYYTWIGSRDLPYKYSDTPSPIADDHMIATVIEDGELFFLDATGQYMPMGLPTSMIQGKECLIDRGDSYQLAEVPVISRDQNLMKDSVSITLEGGNIKGTGRVKLTGYAKVFNTYKLIKSSQKDVDSYVNRVLSKGNNKFLVREFELSNLHNLDTSLYIDYAFSIHDYYKRIGDEIYVNLILDKSLVDDYIENRTQPLENEYKYTNSSIASLAVPSGYEVSFVPEDESFYSDHFGYTISYRVEFGRIISEKVFYVDYLIMDPAGFGAWNEAITRYSNACRQAVVLSKKVVEE